MKKIRALIKEESGVVMVFVALAMVTLLSFASFATDLGLSYYQKSKLQTAVDSAAIAAVHKLPNANVARQTAEEYMVKNGFSAENLQVTYDATNFTCSVSSTQEMQTFFANMFNVSSVTMSAKATSKLYRESGRSRVFDYCIFVGDEDATLQLGGWFSINGSVHSNGRFSVSPSYGYIRNTLEASHGGNFNQWTATAGEVIYDAEVIEMPDLSEFVNASLPSSYTTINKSIFSGYPQGMHLSGNLKIDATREKEGTLSISVSRLTLDNCNLYVDGNLTIGGGAPILIMNGGSIYCTGNVNFTNTVILNGGFIYADGDIKSEGGSNVFSTNKAIAIYSKNGDISLNAHGTEVHGIAYAPNGNIRIVGNTVTFYGSIIGKTVTGVPARLSMGENVLDLPFEIGSEGVAVATLID